MRIFYNGIVRFLCHIMAFSDRSNVEVNTVRYFHGRDGKSWRQPNITAHKSHGDREYVIIL